MKKLNLRSMRSRMTLLLLIAVLLVLVLFAATASVNFRRLISREIEAESSAALSQAAMHIEYLQENIHTLAVRIASDADVQEGLPQGRGFDYYSARSNLSRLLQTYMTQTDYVHGINVLYSDGGSVSTTGMTINTLFANVGPEWVDKILENGSREGFSDIVEFDMKQFKDITAVAYAMRFNSYAHKTTDYATVVLFVRPDYFYQGLRGSFPNASCLVLREGNGSAIYAEGDPEDDSMRLEKALGYGWTLEARFTQSAMFERYNAIVSALTIVSLLIAEAVLVASVITVNRWTAPIQRLTALTEQVARGDLDVRVGKVTDDEFGELTLAFADMAEHLKGYIDRLLQEEKERNRLQTELQMARINPHFIYNTLDSVIWLARMGNTEEMIRMCKVFIAILQDTLHTDGVNASATLAKEIEIVRDYETIQSVRYEGRFEIRYELDPLAERAVVPKLLLQPLVENALYHGILPDEGRVGHIVIKTRALDDRAEIEVWNDGLGVSPEKLAEISGPGFIGVKSQMHSIGLSNIRKRLDLMYPGRHAFYLSSEPGEGTRIVIEVPMNEISEGGNDDEENDRQLL